MTGFSLEHRVGWPDVDLAGIVYFPRFFSYFEMAELAWVRSHGLGYEELLAVLDVWLPRAAVHCNYHAPARFEDVLSIEMKPMRIGETSFTLGYDAYRVADRKHLADGYTVIVTVSRSRFEPIRIPERLRDMLKGLEENENRTSEASA